MHIKSNQQILDEIRVYLESHIITLRGRVRGRLLALQQKLPDGAIEFHSSIAWVLRAQLGTLDKIQPIFQREGEYSTFELLAITRNLFENLIWVRLFEKNAEWGLILFEQLLLQQRQSLNALLEKIEAEARLFEEFDKRDSENLREHLIAPTLNGATPADVRKFSMAHHAASERLDDEARRTFALYADGAKWNGYSFQAYRIREQAIPRSRKDLEGVEQELERYRAVKEALLSPAMLARSNERFVWKARANDVGMGHQYDFLYSFTSRLLHATPMNLITSKSLTDDEARMMLDYCYTAIVDLVECIEAFDYPGRANLFVVDLEEVAPGATDDE